MRRTTRPRLVPAALAGAAALALSGCYGPDVPPLDPPQLRLNIAPTYCTGLWHGANQFFDSLSWALYAALVETDDGSELPSLAGAEITVDGLPDAKASVDDDGVVVGVLPLNSYGDYEITGLDVTTADGQEFALSVDYSFAVGADESDVVCEGDEAQSDIIRQGIQVSPIVDF